ncbi:MAG TPA: allantoinase AllB [Opitutaceae bacterium]|jgi:allantoinase
MSASVDLLVRGGSIVTGSGVSRADIAVAEGRIVRIAPRIDMEAREFVDAAGHYVMAGIIDSHVHFNEPGRTEWEGIATGSSALAAGGGTAFFDMPLNSIPPSTTAANVALKRAAAERSSRTDFGIWGGLIPGNSDHFEGMREAGVIGLKAFMCGSGVEEFPLSDPGALRIGMKRAASLGMMVAVHAEDEQMALRLAAEAHKRGSDVRTWLTSRPVSLELAAIRTATEIAGETGCALHIVHVSSPEGVDAAIEARRKGVNVSIETCPHYLLLTDEDVVRIGAPAKCFPPLRNEGLRQGLWAALDEGKVDTIGSDHSPAPPEMKRSKDFFEVWGGISGCQHAFMLLLSEALARSHADVALPRLTRVLSENVARRYGVDKRKGRLAEGLDADITILSVGQPRELRNDQLLYRHRQGPYDGRISGVSVVRTIVRGATVFSKGRIAPGAPGGHLVRPA